MDSSLKEGYRKSGILTRKHAKTFYFCSLFLEKNKRTAAYSVYAFSRLLDDCFDVSKTLNGNEINKWEDTLTAIYGTAPIDNPVFLALRSTVTKYNIPIEYFKELIRGMEMDITYREYNSFDDLYKYCYRVAGVIGLMMLKIFGCTHEDALLYAEKLGIAMQITNILRDIKEDMAMGRLYLPLRELDKYNLSREKLKHGKIDKNFKDFMKFQIQRARSYYNESYPGLKMVEDKNSRFIARLMGEIYSGILDSIEKNDYDVFTKRNYVPFKRKIILFFTTLRNVNES